MKATKSDKAFAILSAAFMIFLFIVMIYPLYFSLIASISDPYKVAKGQVFFFPEKISFDSYRYVFENNSIWGGYLNSLSYTAGGTALSLAMTIPAAYALSKKEMFLRTFFSWFFLFTMYFSGGLVPSYILVKNLNLLNRPWTLIALGCVNVFNIIITRVFFQTTIPESLYEAARIDGASEFYTFFRIALPLSGAIVAVIGLYYCVARWNDYYTALIYVQDKNYQPLQSVLRGIQMNLLVNIFRKCPVKGGELSRENAK